MKEIKFTLWLIKQAIWLTLIGHEEAELSRMLLKIHLTHKHKRIDK